MNCFASSDIIFHIASGSTGTVDLFEVPIVKLDSYFHLQILRLCQPGISYSLTPLVLFPFLTLSAIKLFICPYVVLVLFVGQLTNLLSGQPKTSIALVGFQHIEKG